MDEAPPAIEETAEHVPTTVPGMDSESEALELAHAAEEIPELGETVPADIQSVDQDIPTLHWEETEDPYDLYVADTTDAAEAGPVEEVAAIVPAANADDAADWSTVSPWWSDEPQTEADVETLAASASQGFVEPESAKLVEPIAEEELPELVETVAEINATAIAEPEEAADEHVITLELHSDEEPPLEFDLDEFREEDAVAETPVPGTHDHIGNSVTEMALPAGPGEPVVEPEEPGLHEVAPVVAAVVAEPAPPAMLDEAAIIEMTASVAAHLAVDISTEVEQLTRRHFAHMMQTLYGEALTQLIDQVGSALEARLAPRIDKLVREELRARGLTTPGDDDAQ